MAGLARRLRHLINVTCARCLGTGFPWGTFIINITGSTVMGLIAGYLAFKGEASQPWRLFLMTGILGGYTTFSAYSLDAALLYERGELGIRGALRRWLGRALDCRAVCRPRAGPPVHLNEWPARGQGRVTSSHGHALRCAWVSASFRLRRHHGGTKQGWNRITRQPIALVRTSDKRPGACR